MALRGLRSALNRGDPKDKTADTASRDVQWGPPAGSLDVLSGSTGVQPADRGETPGRGPAPASQPSGARWIRAASQAPTPAATPRPTPAAAPGPTFAAAPGPTPAAAPGPTFAAAPGPTFAAAPGPTPARDRPTAPSIFDELSAGSAATARGGTSAMAPDAQRPHCPACGGVIARGARRCDACGRRLLLDVPAGKASMLVGTGLLVGLVIGGLAAAVALPRDAATAGIGPSASNPAPSLVPVSANAAAALRGTTALNGRLAAEAEPLSAALAEASFPVQDVVKVLRRMSSDARAATAMVGSLADWPEATSHQAQLAAFYDQLTGEINAGLSASVTSPDAYKASTRQILTTLRSIVGLDAAARDLATQSGITLPVIVIPVAIR